VACLPNSKECCLDNSPLMICTVVSVVLWFFSYVVSLPFATERDSVSCMYDSGGQPFFCTSLCSSVEKRYQNLQQKNWNFISSSINAANTTDTFKP